MSKLGSKAKPALVLATLVVLLLVGALWNAASHDPMDEASDFQPAPGPRSADVGKAAPHQADPTKRKKITTIGTVTTMLAAISRFHCVPN